MVSWFSLLSLLNELYSNSDLSQQTTVYCIFQSDEMQNTVSTLLQKVTRKPAAWNHLRQILKNLIHASIKDTMGTKSRHTPPGVQMPHF